MIARLILTTIAALGLASLAPSQEPWLKIEGITVVEEPGSIVDPNRDINGDQGGSITVQNLSELVFELYVFDEGVQNPEPEDDPHMSGSSEAESTDEWELKTNEGKEDLPAGDYEIWGRAGSTGDLEKVCELVVNPPN